MCKVRQQVAQGGLQARWVITVGPRPAEPANAEIEISLPRFDIARRGAVGFVIVPAVFECDSMAPFEFFVIPFGDLGMCKKRVVAAEEACFGTTCDIVGCWVVAARWVVGVLPVTVLGLVNGEPFVYVGIVAGDDEFGIVKEVVNDAAVGPGAVLSEESERCIPVEELWMSASGHYEPGGTLPLPQA